MGVNSLPKTVTRQRRGCDLNPGPSAPDSSTLTTRLPNKVSNKVSNKIFFKYKLTKTATVKGHKQRKLYGLRLMIARYLLFLS